MDRLIRKAKKLEEEIKAAKEIKEMYKECFEKFILSDQCDEATESLSTYGSGLAKEIFIRRRVELRQNSIMWEKEKYDNSRK